MHLFFNAMWLGPADTFLKQKEQQLAATFLILPVFNISH
jgi:hypothetical protein